MKARLDSFINTITMYRLALYCLLITAVYALGLAFVGVLDFNPLTMLIGLLILIAVGYVVNYALAYIYKLPTNFESTFITSLILFFIFSPPREDQSYVILALVAALASVSKYILAWRGRHIFNPAAIAAVITGVSGLQYASWWVGTGSLAPIVCITGALILYKTRRLTMGGIYIIVSIATIMVAQALSGTFGSVPIAAYITSWPLLFFAGFMLSEPLTQAPRRYQRYGIAAGVAIIANAGLSIGPIFVTPELALATGNLIAFLFGQRRGIQLRFMARKPLPGGQIEYAFESPSRLKFLPGQYLELILPHPRPDARGTRRMFTVTSTPDDDIVRIATRHRHQSSSFKKALLHLPARSLVRATGIYGDFVLPTDIKQKFVMIAGGIGITPFISQLDYLLRHNQRRQGVLLYFVENKEDVIYEDILRNNRHGVVCHILTGRLDDDTVKKYAADINDRLVYISGPPGMVDYARSLTSLRGSKGIVTDFFSGY